MQDARQDVFVVNFFRTPDGELHCRIRDPFTKEHWIACEPERLAGLLTRRSEPTSRPSRWFE